MIYWNGLIHVLHYQNGTAYTYLGLKCSTRVFFCSIFKSQPNYIELEKNSRVSMYSNWKVVTKDSHPSGLSPKIGMSCYNSNYHPCDKGLFTMAQTKKSPMIITHSSRWREKRDAGPQSRDMLVGASDEKKIGAPEVDIDFLSTQI